MEGIDLESLDPISYGVVPLTALYPHPKNYQIHPESQLEELRQSLEDLTQFRSIVIQDRGDGTYWIVAGEGTVEGARRANYRDMRAEIIPASWPPDLVEAILAADNEHHRNALPNASRLATLLQSLKERGYKLPALGTSQQRLNTLLSEMRRDQSTAFLQPLLQKPLSFPTGAPEMQEAPAYGLSPAAPVVTPGQDAPPPIYFALTFTVTLEQRAIILAAIQQVKQRSGFTTSQDALAFLCEQYTKEAP